MGADYRTNAGNQRHIHAAFVLNDILQHLCVFQAVSIGNEDRGIRPDRLAQFLCQRLDGLFPSVHLGHLDQVAFIVHMQHRLHIQRRTQQSCGCADPSAALQVYQVFHRKPVAHMGNLLPERFRVFFQRHTCVPVLHGQIHKQAFAGGSGQRIDRFDFPVRILFCQSFCNLLGIVRGHAQSAGQPQVQDILTSFKDLSERVFKRIFIDAGGLGNPSRAHGLVELADRFVVIFLFHVCICKQERQRKHLYIPFRQFVRMNITSGICKQYIILSHFFPPAIHCRPVGRRQ